MLQAAGGRERYSGYTREDAPRSLLLSLLLLLPWEGGRSRAGREGGLSWTLRRSSDYVERLRRLLGGFACVTAMTVSLSAQQAATEAPKEDYVRAHYTKYEYRIPMRDGKRLFTAVYVPKDAARRAVSVSDGPHAL